MKKFFVSFALFAALIFVVSCGGGSKNNDSSDTTDSGETVTDEDKVDTDATDSGSGDNTDTASDGGDTASDDDTDSGNDSDSEPVETEEDKCKKMEGIWQDGKCTREGKCDEKPANTEWNGASSYTQYYINGEWMAAADDGGYYTVDAEHSEEEGLCHFKCVENYYWVAADEGCQTAAEVCKIAAEDTTWNASQNKCTRTVNCSSNKPEHTVWNGESSYTQTFNFADWSWSPAEPSPEYSEEAGLCHYKCAEDSSRIGLKCLQICSASTTTFPCHDPETGLIWSEKSPENMNLEGATGHCDDLNDAAYGDFINWHLPNISELRTLIQNCSDTETGGSCRVVDTGNSLTSCLSNSCWTDSDCGSCSNDSTGGYSKFGETGLFWSSSASDSPNYKWVVNFFYGSLGSAPVTATFIALRCVRPDGTPLSKCISTGGIWDKTAETCQCPAGSEWNGTMCVEMTEVELCVSAGGTWDGSTCICQENYFWDDSSSACVNPCDDDPCEAISGFNSICTASSATERHCLYKDTTSGLIWSEKSPENMNLEDATGHCDDLNDAAYGGFTTDWRLPNISELRTLIQNCEGTVTGGACGVTYPVHLSYSDKNDACASCSSDSTGGHSKFGDTGWFWSSSILTGSSSSAWGVHFSTGTVGSASVTATSIALRCVRPDGTPLSKCISTGGTWDATAETCQCPAAGYSWTGEQCLPVCSASTTTFPCYDPESKLTWSAKAQDEMAWQDNDESGNIIYPASSYCEGLNASNYGGYSDGWHLPTVSELRTLIQNCSGTQMPGGSCGVREDKDEVCLESSCQGEDCGCSSDSTGGHSKFGETGWFWSTSTMSDSINYAWIVGFYYGDVFYYGKDDDDFYVRCVR